MLSILRKGLLKYQAPLVHRYPKEHGYIYTADIFGEVMRRECARADRTGHGFSFVVIRVPAEDEIIAGRLIDTVGDRLRVTDQAGWLEPDFKLGVLLYACTTDAAGGFVDRLCEAAAFPSLQYDIYAYPESLPADIFDGHAGGARRDDKCYHYEQNDPGSILSQLATSSEFREELQRVQARIERTNSFFSLVIFDLRGPECNLLAEALAETLLQRVRSSDFVGWFDHNSIGVILDGCLVCSALNFGNSICQLIAGGRPPPRRVTIQSFSAEWKDPAEIDYIECKSCTETNREQVEDDAAGLTCPALCMRKNAFMPTSITVEYGVVLGSEMRSPAGAGLPLWKRLTDVIVSLTVLALLSPILLLVSILVKITSPGGVIYRQERIGYLGHPFVLYKFRSMSIAKSSADHEKLMKHLIADEVGADEPMLKEKANPGARTTWIGKLVRATSLDEIPQLVNVLKGEMSLVGPRPPIPYEVEVYKRWHGGRFDSVPGLTGLWQVSGKNRLSFKEMARLDIQYSRNLSFWNDLKIICKTPGVIVREFLASFGRKRSEEGPIED